MELETFYDVDRAIPESEGTARLKHAIDGFHFLFLQSIDKLRIKDHWPKTLCHIAPFESGVIEHSAKMETDFTIGVSIYGWFFQATVLAPHCLRHMKDDYWLHIAKIATLGKAELVDYGRPVGWNNSKEVRKLTQHKGSVIFSMLRDYTLLESQNGHCDSLGAIQIYLPLESSEQEVEAFYEAAINGMYRSNYLLYRYRYINRKRVEQEHLKKLSGKL